MVDALEETNYLINWWKYDFLGFQGSHCPWKLPPCQQGAEGSSAAGALPCTCTQGRALPHLRLRAVHVQLAGGQKVGGWGVPNMMPQAMGATLTEG